MGCTVYTLPACYPETVAELSQVRDRSDPTGASPVSGEPSAAFSTSRRGGHRRRRPGRRSRRTRRRLGRTVTAGPAPHRPQRLRASHRDTHLDASATTLRTRRTRPSRPPPRPSRPTPSKPHLNNLPPRTLRGGRPRGGRRPRRAYRRPDGTRKDAPRSRRVQGALSAARPRGSTSRLAPIPTKPRTSRTSHASRLGSVHPLRGSSGAGNGALGGSFRPALDHAAIRTAQSRGNFRMHPECRPERSSQGARTGDQRGPRARRRRGPR